MSRGATAGGVVWIGIAAASQLHWAQLSAIELLFLLGPLVIVPLGFCLCVRTAPEIRNEPLIRFIHRFQFPAALCAAASFLLKQGTGATILVLPWLGLGCLIGLHGLKGLFRGKVRNFKRVCMTVSFLYLPIGCAWLVASRLGFSPMGFQEPIVLLTAVHFHFAGFAAPLLALAAGTAIEEKSVVLRRVFRVFAAGVLAGPGLLAAGFVIGPRLKLAMALLVAVSEVGLSLFFLASVGSLRPRLAQVFVTASAASVLFAMVLAGVWAIGEFPLQPFVHLDQMAKFHGNANAFGFILCGLVGWTLAASHTAHLHGDSI